MIFKIGTKSDPVELAVRKTLADAWRELRMVTIRVRRKDSLVRGGRGATLTATPL